MSDIPSSSATRSNRGDHPRYSVARRVTVVGAVVNLLLAVAKVVTGFVGQSQALIADGIHSFSDLISDAVVLVASKHGSREPDPEHPYGHGRIETLATVVVGLLLFGVTTGILYDAATRLMEPERLLQPGLLALGAAVFSVLAKEALTQYTLAAAKRIRSSLLRANAWHHRSDAISSVVVIIGVAGSMAGLPYLDAVAAVFVALMIAKIAWDLSWGGIRELIDTGLDDETVEHIRSIIMSVEGVEALHMLRSRRMGADALVDVHILLKDPLISVSEGHQISETIRVRLVRELEDVEDVTVHIDPEDDEIHAPCAGLPLRGQVLEALHQQWEGVSGADAIERITLHYLNGRVHLELLIADDLTHNSEKRDAIKKAIAGPAEQIDYVGSVTVKFS